MMKGGKLTVVFTLVWAVWLRECYGQKNSYLGLWGRIFDDSFGKNETIAERLKAGAVEAESRLLQRINERTADVKPSVLSFSKLGMDLPEVASKSFEGDMCLRLQNFVGIEGHAAALLGPPPCGLIHGGTGTLDRFEWGDRTTFILDCAVDVPLADAYAHGGDTVMERLRNAASELSSNTFQKKLLCQLTLVSDKGAGQMIQGNTSIALASPAIKAILLRVCDGSSPDNHAITAGSDVGDGSMVQLHSLRLDGRPLVDDYSLIHNNAKYSSSEDASSRDGSGATQAGCYTSVFRVPGRALSEGFTLTGTMEFDFVKGSSESMTGQMSYVELQMGGLHILTSNNRHNEMANERDAQDQG